MSDRWSGINRAADIARQIEASSLGTPEAKRLRASVSDETAARVLARAKEIEQEEAMTTDRESREELAEAFDAVRAALSPAQGETGAGDTGRTT